MPRTLSEAEFAGAQQKVLAQAPKGLDEAGFQLWVDRQGKSLLDGAIAEAENTPQGPDGSALSRIGTALAGVPAGIAKGIEGIFNPATAAMNGMGMVDASLDQAKKARDAYQMGRYPEAFGHAVGTVPGIGTPLAQTGEQWASGDYAGGLTNTALAVGSAVGPRLARTAGDATVAAAEGARAYAPAVKDLAVDVLPGGRGLKKFVRAVGKVQAVRDPANQPAAPIAKTAVNAPTHPMAKGMTAGNADAQASIRMVRGMSASAPPVEATAAAPAAPAASAPAASARAVPPSPRAAAQTAPAAPSPNPGRTAASGADTIDLPWPERTTGQQSPAWVRSDLGIAARRAKVTLTEPEYQQAADLVRTGQSPVDAVLKVGKRPELTAMTTDELQEVLRMVQKGQPYDEAVRSVQTQRTLTSRLKSPSPEQVRQRVAKRNATKKWPTEPTQ